MLVAIKDRVYRVWSINNYGYLPMITLEGGMEYYIAPSSERAGEQARDYWREMAENDPQEFAALVGEETLVSWASGQYAGPGSTHVQNLEEWLDLWLTTPEECWASYDGTEEECSINRNVAEELCNDGEDWEGSGFKGVCYRHN
jgi:hypothetical protein